MNDQFRSSHEMTPCSFKIGIGRMSTALLGLTLLACASVGLSGESRDLSEQSKDYFSADERIYRNWAEWASRFLIAAGEEVLRPTGQLASTGSTEDEIYRFTFMPSFHPVRVFRVARQGSDFRIWATAVSRETRRKPVRVVKRLNRTVSESDWLKFLDLLDKADFWNLEHLYVRREEECVRFLRPGETQADCPIMVKSDGSEWFLEGADATRWRVVHEWGDEGPFREACEFLVKLSGMNVPELADY